MNPRIIIAVGLFLAVSGFAISLEQAKAKGLGPCSRCNPPQ